MMVSSVQLVALIIPCACLLACGSSTSAIDQGDPTALHELLTPKKGCEIGGAKIRDPSSMSHALNFAITVGRANLASAIKENIKQMFKVYVFPEGASEGQEIVGDLTTIVIRGLTELDVLGGEVVRQHRVEDEVLVMVCINKQKFYDAFDQMSHLSEARRQSLKARAKAMFAD